MKERFWARRIRSPLPVIPSERLSGEVLGTSPHSVNGLGKDQSVGRLLQALVLCWINRPSYADGFDDE